MVLAGEVQKQIKTNQIYNLCIRNALGPQTQFLFQDRYQVPGDWSEHVNLCQMNWKSCAEEPK